MVGDLTDIGRNTPETPFEILPTNALGKSGDIDTTITLPDGRVLKQTSALANKRLGQAVASALKGEGLAVKATGKVAKFDAIFTTYSQLQPVKQKKQHGTNACLNSPPARFSFWMNRTMLAAHNNSRNKRLPMRSS